MKLINTAFFVLFFTPFLTSCFFEKAKPVITLSEEKNDTQLNLADKTTTLVKTAGTQLFKKEQREAIYFSASLEKEALKILTKNSTFDELTLFSVLSYALETSYGVKKVAPSHLDCSRFRFSQDLASNKNELKKISIYKICQRPESRIAEIEISSDESLLSVTFLSKEWISVLGLSATLSGDNVRCQLQIEKKKLARLSCENWIRTLVVTNTSAEELRLQTFVFDRKNPHQFVLKGGQYKDLVERKKIEIEVPLEGKIKRFEKEIEVIDQYAESLAEAQEKPSSENSPSTRMQVMPIKSGGTESRMNENESSPIDTLETQESGGVPAPSRRGR